MSNDQMSKRIDKLTFALLLLLSSLRANIKVGEKEAVASIPVSVLNSIERILKNI
jgi:hypothetical protein